MDTIGPPIKNENPQCSPYRHPTQRNDGLRNTSCTTFLGDDSLGGSSSSLDTIRAPTNHTNHEYSSSTTLQSNGSRCNVSFKTSASSDSSFDVLNYSYVAEIGLHLTPIPSSGEQPDDLVDFGHELKSAIDSILEAYPKYIGFIAQTFYLLIRY